MARRNFDRNRISYLKRHLAGHSKVAAFLALAGLTMLLICFSSAVNSQGQATEVMAALGFSSLLVSVAGILYSIRSFGEKDKNYILARISGFLCGTVVIIWLMVMFVGIGG